MALTAKDFKPGQLVRSTIDILATNQKEEGVVVSANDLRNYWAEARVSRGSVAVRWTTRIGKTREITQIHARNLVLISRMEIRGNELVLIED